MVAVFDDFTVASAAGSVVLLSRIFFLFWLPGSTLLTVCLGRPQIPRQDWWLGM